MLFCVHWLLLLATTINSNWAQIYYPDDLVEYLQPDDVEEHYHFAPANDTKSCTRECLPNAPPRLCYYRFILENFATMSQACEMCPRNLTHCYNPQCLIGDGVERGVVSVNRRLPGPSIQVCLGDRIVVDVINQMPGRSTTIHWHGIFMKGTPYYDGVPMVTQCPIFEDNGFRYDFQVKQHGSFFWHSHDGIQKVDGLQGSLIVRRPDKQDPNSGLYDYDLPAHVVMLMDWFHTDASQHFPGLLRPYNPLDRTYYLINGKGRFHNPGNGEGTDTPYHVFVVKPGKRYRFRIIGAICTHCPVRFSIQDHTLTVIATDANSVTPVDVDYLEIYTGERFDVVINTRNKAVKSYWMKVQGLSSCASNYTYQLGILHYEGSDNIEPRFPASSDNLLTSVGVGLNIQNASCSANSKGICINQLEAAEDYDPRIVEQEPDITIPMSFGYYFPGIKREFQNNTYHKYHHPEPNSWVVIYEINNIYYQTPSAPILSQREDIPEHAYCDRGDDGITTCYKDVCNCFNVMKIPLGSVVQLILFDESFGGGLNHPFHLHGFAFYVMAMGYLEPGLETAHHISELLKSKKILQSSAPVLKDTVAVPSEGYTVIRFVADNPGYWLFHCHFLYHHVIGMSVLLQVGEPEEIPPVPKGFPKCGNFFPPLVNKPSTSNKTKWHYSPPRGLF